MFAFFAFVCLFLLIVDHVCLCLPFFAYVCFLVLLILLIVAYFCFFLNMLAVL